MLCWIEISPLTQRFAARSACDQAFTAHQSNNFPRTSAREESDKTRSGFSVEICPCNSSYRIEQHNQRRLWRRSQLITILFPAAAAIAFRRHIMIFASRRDAGSWMESGRQADRKRSCPSAVHRPEPGPGFPAGRPPWMLPISARSVGLVLDGSGRRLRGVGRGETVVMDTGRWSACTPPDKRN